MELERSTDGSLAKLQVFLRRKEGQKIDRKVPCIDTGMGLERVSSVVQGVTSNYETDLFRSLISQIHRLVEDTRAKAGLLTPKDGAMQVPLRILADHIRAIAFLCIDGIVPSNVGRG